MRNAVLCSIGEGEEVQLEREDSQIRGDPEEGQRGSPQSVDPELDEEKGHLPHLAASSAHTLSRLLMILAQYVPQVEKSARNRLAPLDWTAVLRAAGQGGLINPR